MTKQYPSKQYLSEVISNREFAESVPPEIVIVMARQLLASMVQEPVYQVLGDGSWTDYSKQQLEDLLESKPSTLFRVAYPSPSLTQPVPVDEDDNFYSWFGRFWLENYQQNNYTTSAKQMLGTMAEFAFRAGRESATQAGNSPVIPDCWCHTCRPVTMGDMRFVVCPECGNKRCPHANDHRKACTGSNEPGQEGSAYPAAPQQE